MAYRPWCYDSRLNKARKYIHKIQHFKRSLWLDIGCGGGIFTIPLVEELQSKSHVCGLDLNSEALRFLKQTISKDKTHLLSIIQADFHNLPFRRNSWNGCLMSFSLHETKRHPQLIRKISSILSINGMLVILDYQQEYYTPWISSGGKIDKIELLRILKDTKLKSPKILHDGRKHYMISTMKELNKQ